MVLGGHGLFTWGSTAKDCYRTTLEMINRAARWLSENTRRNSSEASASRPCHGPSGATSQRSSCPPFASAFQGQRKVGHFTDTAADLKIVNSREFEALRPRNVLPDHFLRTKIRPLVLPFDPAARDLNSPLLPSTRTLRIIAPTTRPTTGAANGPNSPPMRDPNAVIYLVPGVGMLSFAKDKSTARIASEFYVNAINVMRGASGVGRYGHKEQEAFDIEYWLLEEAKLQRMPKAKSLAGRVALVTGGAGGIGQAIAARLLREAPAWCSPISTPRASMRRS